jgi:hypothetical protein
LSFYEKLFESQLRAIRQLKSPKPEKAKKQRHGGMSNMELALDILRRGQSPLHVSEIIAQMKGKYGVDLDRESLVSALVKKVYRHQELSRTAPNTFRVEGE